MSVSPIASQLENVTLARIDAFITQAKSAPNTNGHANPIQMIDSLDISAAAKKTVEQAMAARFLTAQAGGADGDADRGMEKAGAAGNSLGARISFDGATYKPNVTSSPLGADGQTGLAALLGGLSAGQGSDLLSLLAQVGSSSQTGPAAGSGSLVSPGGTGAATSAASDVLAALGLASGTNQQSAPRTLMAALQGGASASGTSGASGTSAV